MSDPEDLEDGEIEDDEDDDVQPIDPPLTQPSPSDYKDDVEKPSQQDNDRRGGDRLQSPGPSHGPGRDHHSPASAKPNQGRSKPGPVVDDWGAKVESAIANALKKDGVQPPMPSAAIGHNDEEDMPGGGGHAGSGGGSRKSRKRKKSSRGGSGGGGGGAGGGDHQPSSKQQRLDDGDQDGEDRGELDLEYEMLNMRGGSPQAGGPPEVLVSADSEADTHYSSDGSSSVRRGDRDRARDRERERNRERDREQRVADREREREREYNRNKRKQQKQQGRQRSSKAGRDNRKRKRDDSDDEKYRPTGPRKMELCKFYLMDCCAKREKCLYMHKDFPCKYYYLGMKCKEREKCHFSHGEPLTNDLRIILLKHLETAPQEILGDFQRINRETAIGLLNTTHRKLLERYGRQDPVSDGGGGGGGDVKIPSLLDSLSSPHAAGNSRQHRSKNSRWRERLEEEERTPDREEDDVKAHDGEPLSLHHLTSVITATQINDLEQMGIRTLDEISQLTVAQLNDLGLSITQIHDLQVKAMSVKKFRNTGGQAPSGGMGSEGDRSSLDRGLGTAGAKDLDMRILPGLEVPPTPVESATSEHVGGGNKDVDMRILPPIDRSESQSESQAEDSSAPSNPLIPPSLLIKPPTVDYSQYIKDSNLDEDDLNATDTACLISNEPEDEDDDDDDDENHLKINIEEDEESENEDGEKQRVQAANEESGMLLPPLVPPKIDYAQGLGDFLLYGSLDKSAAKKVSPQRSESSPVTASTKDENGSTHTDLNADEVWTPSMSLDSGSTTIATAPTPKPKPAAKTPSSINKRRITSGPPSIYDRDDSDNVSSPDGPRSPVSGGLAYGRSDRPLPLDLNDDGSSEYGADGLRSRNMGFPFKPMMGNYVPATEIDGSIGSHATIQYKVYVVDIPKPNFQALRRSMQRPMGTRDPRLRRLFGLHSDEEDAKDSHDDGDSTEGIKSPDASSTSSPLYGVPSHPASLPPAPHSSMPPQTVPSAPRVDPRKRHAEAKQLAQQQQSDGGAAPFGNLPPPIPNSAPTTQMDVQTILQKSAWYKELGTKHKIMVNQQLAILSTEMKKYHSSDRSTERLSEFMKFLGTNSMLQHILTCLNVYVDHTVAFCEVAVVPNLPPPSFLPNVPPPTLAGGIAVPVHVPPPINVQPLLNVPPPNAMSGGPPPPFLNINGSPGGNNPSRFGPPMPAEAGSNALPPGLLGIAPRMPFEQFLAMGNLNHKGGPDHGGGGNNIPPWTQGNPNNNSMRNMRNNNRIGQNFRNNNDRWNNNGGGGGGGGGGPGMMGGGQGNNGNNRRNNNRRMDRKK
ncbi:protein suppressor of sable [Anopheles bellator]|uniref:protein suppressor of sable n=1 Tax=Anopheles bellator TaxID=139047 RepID=UPI00264727D4|nr:protein suppressor of sable [Anopheles bellator]